MSVHDIGSAASAAVRDAPAVTVGGLLLFGVPVETWVVILTGIYTVVRLVRELHDWYRSRKNDRSSAIHPR